MNSKILTFPKSLNKVLINSFRIAVSNDLDIVLSYRNKEGEVFHVSNIEDEREIKKILKK